MLLADGIVIDMVAGGGILTVLVGVVAALFKLLIKEKDDKHAAALAERAKDAIECDGMKRAYQDIAAEAIKSAQATTDFYRQRDGHPPMLMLAPVVSEGHSPSTTRQREAANIATMRAQVAAIKLAMNQEPRGEPEHAAE